MPMEVPRVWCKCAFMNLKVMCLRIKSRMTRTIWGGGQFLGRRCMYFSMKWIKAAKPSLCGMFVNKDVTSAATKSALDGRGGSFFNKVDKMFCVFNL